MRNATDTLKLNVRLTEYPWVIPSALLLLFAFGNAGFLLGAHWVRAGRDRVNRAFYLGVLAACIAWMVGFYPRTLKLEEEQVLVARGVALCRERWQEGQDRACGLAAGRVD